MRSSYIRFDPETGLARFKYGDEIFLVPGLSASGAAHAVLTRRGARITVSLEFSTGESPAVRYRLRRPMIRAVATDA
jgi:hypothetical protein